MLLFAALWSPKYKPLPAVEADAATCAACAVTACVRVLRSAAEAHSADMATNNFFSHDGSDNSTLADRAAGAGFLTFPLGENIAAGFNSVRSLVLAWMWCAPAYYSPPEYIIINVC